MRLLVSVGARSEARAALGGGADVIDAKQPRRGALAPVRPDVLAAIRQVVGAARPVSAALGDARDEAAIERAAGVAAGLGVAFVKVGFAGVVTEQRARRLATAARRGAGDSGLVLVGYADWRRADSLVPERLVAVAATAAGAGGLLRTAVKDAPLVPLEPPEPVGARGAAAHPAGLFAGGARSLSGSDFPTARAARAH